MKNWNNNNADYYGTGSRYGNSTTRSVNDKRHNISLSKVSDAKSVKFSLRLLENRHKNLKSMPYKFNLSLSKRSLLIKERIITGIKIKSEKRQPYI